MNPEDNKKFKLEDLQKEQPFRVPENYFDSLGVRIADRVQVQEEKKALSFGFVQLKPLLSFAGGFAGLALIIYLAVSIFSNNIPNSKTDTGIADNIEYSIVSGLDEATLVENFGSETSSEADSATRSENKERIIDYLVGEDIDISTIIDEL